MDPRTYNEKMNEIGVRMRRRKKKKKKNAYSFMRFRPELAFPYGGTVAIPVGAGSNVAASTTPYDASAIVIEFSTMRTRTVVRKSDHSTKNNK